jgi:transcriptional regulator with XRE-family HTH domain
MDEKMIAENIRKARLDRRLSIEQLAKLAGLTKGYISKIEKSTKAPPFSTLAKIASAMNTDITLLITTNSETAQDISLSLVRANERKDVMSLRGHHYEALAHRKSGKNMEPYIITPTLETETVFSHEGEEFMYVLEGTHEFIYGNKRYILEEGDSIYFDSAVPHSGRRLSKKKATILVVMYSYKRVDINAGRAFEHSKQ